MRGAVGLCVWCGLLLLAALLAGPVWFDWTVLSQPLPSAGSVVATDPAPNARLLTSPEEISFTTTAPIVPGSARVRLLGVGDVGVALEPATIDPEAPLRIVARLDAPLGHGGFTVIWTARNAADGTFIAETYPFAVGGQVPLGQASGPNQWPNPGAAVLRWLVFMGSAVAGGGFAWGRLLEWRQDRGTVGGVFGSAVTAGAAFAALLAAVASPVLVWRFRNVAGAPTIGEILSLSPGWRIQIAALVALTLLCLVLLVRGDARWSRRPSLAWAGAAAAGMALAGLGLDSNVAAQVNTLEFASEVLHLWTAALWFSGTLLFLAGWRGMGTDVARFRRMRWLGGLLLATAILTGAARAAPVSPMLGEFVASGYTRAMWLKVAVVFVVAALGAVAMLGSGRGNAVQVSRFLGAQAVGAGLAALLSATIALLFPPGFSAQATLAGVALAAVVPLDESAFAAEQGIVHVLTQPASPGTQTVVVRITDVEGVPLPSAAATSVGVEWTPLGGGEQPAVAHELEADPTGTVFTGAVTLGAGWQRAEVAIAPRGGIASRAQFWLTAPDPNVSGMGPPAADDADALALYNRGAASLAALQSVRYTRRVGDGRGAMTREEVSLRGAQGESPAAFEEVVTAPDGVVIERQTILGDRRWILDDGSWVGAEAIPFLVPARWGELYAGAAGFALGSRDAVGGELCQVVMFQTPAGEDPARDRAWYAWWVGLASGQVRREAVVSTRRYDVTEFRDFNAPIKIQEPEVEPTIAGTSLVGESPATQAMDAE